MRFLLPCLLLLLCVPAHAAPADSFLPAPVPSVNALLQQVSSDEGARERYARFFHMDEGRVVPFLRRAATAAHLKHGGRYTQFYVRTGGTIYPAVITLPAGLRVLRLAGTGIFLSQATGNPLRPFAQVTRILPAPPRAAAPPTPPAVPRQTVVPMKAQPVVVPAVRPQPVFQTPPAPEK